jgi:hypothetical protein
MPVTERQLTAFRRDHEGMFQHATSPRHLAGPGDPRHVTHALLAAGWSVTSDAASPQTDLASPDRSAQLQVAPQLRSLGTWWYITADPPGSANWYATFTREVPVEILAGLTDTLLIPAPATSPDPWDIFRSAEWSVTQSENGTGLKARSPDQRAVVTYDHHVDDERPYFNWKIRVTKYPDDTTEYPSAGLPVWTGWLNERTPAHAISGFATALTSSEPLLRGWGMHNWNHDVRNERVVQSGKDVAETHRQRLKQIQARVGQPGAVNTRVPPPPRRPPAPPHPRQLTPDDRRRNPSAQHTPRPERPPPAAP